MTPAHPTTVALLSLLLLAPHPARAQQPPAATAPLGDDDFPTTRPADLPAPIPVDPDLPRYDKVPTRLKGTLTAVGSSTTMSLIAAWADGFKELYPDVDSRLRVGGSAAATPALVAKKDPVQMASMNRPMTDAERAAFRDRYGHDPTAIQVAISAVGVFVSVDNPCTKLTFKQLDSMFSRDRRRGGPPATRWRDVGLTGDWADVPIVLYGLTPAHGEHDLVQSRVLLGDDFRYVVTDNLTHSAVVQDVAVDRGAIGYANISDRTRRTKPLPLSVDDAGPFVPPDYANCLSGNYPLATPLYIYVDKPPGKPLDPLVREFLRYACGRDAQQVPARNGVYPLTPDLARRQLELLRP